MEHTSTQGSNQIQEANLLMINPWGSLGIPTPAPLTAATVIQYCLPGLRAEMSRLCWPLLTVQFWNCCSTDSTHHTWKTAVWFLSKTRFLVKCLPCMHFNHRIVIQGTVWRLKSDVQSTVPQAGTNKVQLLTYLLDAVVDFSDVCTSVFLSLTTFHFSYSLIVYTVAVWSGDI